MLTIGAFGRLGGVSVRALRHYEQVGLLLPTVTDPATGYRYYEARQLARLHRIQTLQDLGLSLRQVRSLLDEDLGVDELRGMLALARAQLTDRVAADQARLERVEQRLRSIETEDDVSLDLIIKTVPEVRVAQIRYRGAIGLDWYRLAEFAAPASEALAEALRLASVRPVGPRILHYEARADVTLTPIVAIPIGDQPFTDTDEVETATLPAIDAVVTVLRVNRKELTRGVHDQVGPTYWRMARHAEDHGYVVQGIGRDHIISSDDDEWVGELQLPVAKADAPTSLA